MVGCGPVHCLGHETFKKLDPGQSQSQKMVKKAKVMISLPTQYSSLYKKGKRIQKIHFCHFDCVFAHLGTK